MQSGLSSLHDLCHELQVVLSLSTAEPRAASSGISSAVATQHCARLGSVPVQCHLCSGHGPQQQHASSLAVKHRRFRLDIRKNLFSKRVIWHWRSCPGSGESPSLEIFKKRGHVALRCMVSEPGGVGLGLDLLSVGQPSLQ